MNVYAVISDNSISGYFLEAVFSTQAKAETGQAILKANNPNGDGYLIRAFVLDELPPSGTAVMGLPAATVGQARNWIVSKSQGSTYSDITLRDIASTYYRVGAEYGVRPDLALAMAAKETGFFRFVSGSGIPSIVEPSQWNFAGIGATGGVPGVTFPSVEAGVRGHMLRMRMYAVNAPSAYDEAVLVRPLPASHWGKYPTIEQFNGVWAVPGTDYGQSIVNHYLSSLRAFADEPAPTTGERIADLERRVALLEGRDRNLQGLATLL